MQLPLYLVHRCDESQCNMFHEQQRCNVQQWLHVLLANKPRSHLRRASARLATDGLATRVTLTLMSRGKLCEPITLREQLIINLISQPQYVMRSQLSSVDVETGWMTGEWSSIPGKGKRFSLVHNVPALGPTELPVQWVTEGKEARPWSWLLSSISCWG
jgi:hypothetical protein